MFSWNRMGWRDLLAGLVCVVAAMWWCTTPGEMVQAEVRRTTPSDADQHFKSGGRLAEGVLQEILVVLKRMDDRLARIEQASLTASRTPLPATVERSPADASQQDASTSLPEIKIRRAR
jgi:hypothetical protein